MLPLVDVPVASWLRFCPALQRQGSSGSWTWQGHIRYSEKWFSECDNGYDIKLDRSTGSALVRTMDEEMDGRLWWFFWLNTKHCSGNNGNVGERIGKYTHIFRRKLYPVGAYYCVGERWYVIPMSLRHSELQHINTEPLQHKNPNSKHSIWSGYNSNSMETFNCTHSTRHWTLNFVHNFVHGWLNSPERSENHLYQTFTSICARWLSNTPHSLNQSNAICAFVSRFIKLVCISGRVCGWFSILKIGNINGVVIVQHQLTNPCITNFYWLSQTMPFN